MARQPDYDDPYNEYDPDATSTPESDERREDALSYTLHDPPTGPGTTTAWRDDPEQWTEDTKRWSYHRQADPYGGAAGAWARQYYNNPNIDPGAEIAKQVAAFRKQHGSLAGAGDVEVMEMIASGRTPTATSQTPAGQWNTQTPGVTPPPTTPTGGASPSGQQLLDLLMARARQGLAVDRNDPTIRAQVDPLTAQMERTGRNYLDTLSEQGMGRPLNMAGEQRMMAERVGQSAGQLEAETIGREIGQRRDDIRSALAQWGDILTNDQRAAIERELGYLNDRARTADRESVMERFLREMARREWEWDNPSVSEL